MVTVSVLFALPLQICSVLQFICRKESIPLSDEVAINVARQSQRNLRRAILMLEACKVQYGTLVPQGGNDTLVVQKTDWEAYISQLAAEILREQSPQKLLAAREKLYELLVNCIPADVIITTLALDLCKCLDDCVKHEVIEWAAFYEHRICQGSKDIFHLEAFIAKFMAIYKRYLNDLFG
jgi:replication factor C subunit 3/5